MQQLNGGFEMSEELKKCPFCGADSDISVQDYDTEDPYYVVACTNCNMAHSSSDDENVAIRNWNDRPIEDAQAARIAELEKELEQMRTVALGYCELARRLQESLDESNRYWDKALVEARKLTESSEGD